MTMPPKPKTARVRKISDVALDVPQDSTAEQSQNVEKLTPRDLRRARRKARRLGIPAADDYEAARLLQERGIDLDARESVLDIVPGQNAGRGPETGEDTVQLPAEMMNAAVIAKRDGMPPAIIDENARAKEIAKIQRQLVKRRRRRLAYLFAKLAFFVILPTVLVGNYYYNDATPMFETSSEFVIQKSEGAGGSGGIGGLFSGTGFATSQDSIAVQGYLTSLEAMKQLDADHQFIAHFQQDWIDDIQRLPAEATLADAYKVYEKRVKVGFDPTEGIIRMQVNAASPETAVTFANALISYAEARIDNLSSRVRSDQMAGAMASFEEADREMIAAQQRVLELQQVRGVLSAEVEISAQMSIINSLELERESKQLDLAEINANARPNQARAAVLEADIARLNSRIDELRGALTNNSENSASLARISGELTVAEADLANRQLMLQSSLQQLETARIEANRQVRYLSLGVSPVEPDVAAYPRKFENTVLAFVIFLSLYILVSLTVSILREQVSV